MRHFPKLFLAVRYTCLSALVMLGLASIIATGDGDSDILAGGGNKSGQDTLKATITQPADNSSFTAGQRVLFKGKGIDLQGESLPAAAFVWESSIDGQIHAGSKNFSINTLSAGQHTITLTVTDIYGASGNDSITVIINGGQSSSLAEIIRLLQGVLDDAIPPGLSLVPDTGQTTCYDDDGTIIDPCPEPGEFFYGQDACYTIDPPSYTKLDADGDELPDGAVGWTMVRDNVTGLIWEVKTNDGGIHDKDDQYNWSDAADHFIFQLNDDNFGGYNDWRLPTIKELIYIANYGASDPTIDEGYFPNTMSSCWSSTTCAWDADSAWLFRFSSGHNENDPKSTVYHVRAVRGGE